MWKQARPINCNQKTETVSQLEAWDSSIACFQPYNKNGFRNKRLHSAQRASSEFSLSVVHNNSKTVRESTVNLADAESYTICFSFTKRMDVVVTKGFLFYSEVKYEGFSLRFFHTT